MDAAGLLSEARIVPVVVIDDANVAVPMARTLLDSGIKVIEITLRTAAALDAIERIAVGVPELLVGAGSIRRVVQFEQIKNAGARFAVSPGHSDALLDAADESQMPFVPGAVSASEVVRLLERGYSLIKFFPAELAGGIAMIKALGGPLPEARFVPTGGITPAMAADYLALPNVSAIGGSWITPGQLLSERNFAAIGKLAVDAVKMGAR